MASRTLVIFVVLALVCSTSFAKKKKHPGGGGGTMVTILEVSPASVTVDAGNDVQETYNITGTTTATLNGTAVNPDDLRAGMVANITLASNNKDIVSLAAKPAPRVTKKPTPPKETIWVTY